VQVCSSCVVNSIPYFHGSTNNFYNTQSVSCGSTCPGPTSRTCNNGVMSGDSTYIYNSCSVSACGGSNTVSIDCTGGGNNPTVKVGAAAIGSSGDKWNTIQQEYGWGAPSVPGSLVYTDNSNSGITVSGTTFSGSYWDNPGAWNSGGFDTMFKRFIYTDGNTYMTFTLANFPTSKTTWYIYLYGKAYDTACGDQNSNFNVKVMNGGSLVGDYGYQQISGSARPWDSSNPQPVGGAFQQNVHYVRFTVSVYSGQSVVITANKGNVAGGCPSKPYINGIQLQGF